MMKEKVTELLQARKRLAKQMPDPAISLAGSLMSRMIRPLITAPLVRSFAPPLLGFQTCFTRPSFASFWALTRTWILCSGRRSLTRIIQSAQLTEFKHFCSFPRFFSQARWNLDDLGRCIFQLLLPFCAEVLVGAVDDTLAP